MKVVKVTLDSFQLEDGSEFPIIPPLTEEMSAEEYQIHYDRACNLVQSIQNAGRHNQNAQDLE